MRNFIIAVSLLLMVGATSSCSLFGGGGKPQAQASEQQGKKKRAGKCKDKTCHVRMNHFHEGSEMRGKSSWFLKPFFFFNKNPKYGQGFKKQKRDPHQWGGKAR